jgi:hypothetical protein
MLLIKNEVKSMSLPREKMSAYWPHNACTATALIFASTKLMLNTLEKTYLNGFIGCITSFLAGKP